MITTDFQEKALLVTLSISQWKGRKLDKEITKEVENIYTVQQAGNYTKALVTSEDLARIRQSARALYDFHQHNTLPWNDKGDRLLPASNYFTYVDGAGKLKQSFEDAVQGFINNWDLIQANAQVRLNGLYRAGEYPKVSELPDRFKVAVDFSAVPQTDFRLPLPEQHLTQLKVQADNRQQERFAEAQAENWRRIREQLGQMKAVFQSEDRAIFTSLFDSLSELVSVLPNLNVTEDPALDQAVEELRQLIMPADQMRKHKELRKEKAEQVDQIMDKFKSFF